MVDERTRIDTVEARGGATPGVMRYVLGVSLALVVIGFAIVLLIWK